MNTEIWKRFLRARDEIFKTVEKIFISAVMVRELIHMSHILLRTGKIHHKRNSGTKTNCHKSRKTYNKEKKNSKENEKYHIQGKMKIQGSLPKRLIFHHQR